MNSDLWSEARDCAVEELAMSGQSSSEIACHPMFNNYVRKHYERLSRTARASELIKDVNFPPRYRDASFDTYDTPDERMCKVVEFMKTGKSAVIYGPNGTGKTLLAFCSIRHRMSEGYSAAYLLAVDFFNDIRRSFKIRDADPVDIVMKYASFDYLVVDEIDKTYGSQTEFVYLYQLVNRRYNDMKHTVVIGNSLDKNSISEVIGSSALSRIASEGMIIELNGKDYRKGGRS